MEATNIKSALFHRLKDEFVPPYNITLNHMENIGAVLQSHILSIYNEQNQTDEALEQFDLIFIELSLQDVNLLRFCNHLLEKRSQLNFKVIGIVEGCPFDYNRYSVELQYSLLDVYKKCNGLHILNADFKQHYAVFNKNLFDCGVPYPVTYVQGLAKKEQKDFVIELVNILPDDRNTIYNLSVFEYLVRKFLVEGSGRKLYGVCSTILNEQQVNNFQTVFPNVNFLKVDKIWPQYIAWKKANISLTISLDHRHALGRVSIDCCAAEIPCIGTDRSFYQKRLFPDLCPPINDLDAVYNLVREFVTGREYQFPSLAEYAEDTWKNRFIDIMQKTI